MPELRIRSAEDARRLNTRDWGLPVILISPDGIRYETDIISGESLKALTISYDRVTIIEETGEDVIVPDLIVTLSRLSLERIPKSGENWIVEIPKSPSCDIMIQYMISSTRATEGGKSLELIRLYLQELEQE